MSQNQSKMKMHGGNGIISSTESLLESQFNCTGTRTRTILKIVNNTIEKATSSRLGRCYKLGAIVETGCNCDIFELVDLDAVHKKVKTKIVVKIEDKKTKTPQLHFESKIYDELKGVKGVAKKLGYWSDGHYRYLVMERLGPSLKDMLQFCDGKFSLKTVLLLAEQLLTILRSLHSKKILYRNVKPENFLTLIDEMKINNVYLIDFCSAKHFVDSEGYHIQDCHDKKVICSNIDMLYHSVNNHRGYELSRKDDLESLGYLLIYFLKGSLPWNSRMGITNSQNNDNIWKLKLNIQPECLCEGLPMEFAIYVRYCRNLKFQETPNYDYLLEMFRVLYRMEKFENDNKYDWDKKAKM